MNITHWEKLSDYDFLYWTESKWITNKIPVTVRDGDRVAEPVVQHTAFQTAFMEDVGGGSGPPQWRNNQALATIIANKYKGQSVRGVTIVEILTSVMFLCLAHVCP